MPQEIEHKYLVRRALWTPKGSRSLYHQGYPASVKEREVRVRVAAEEVFLTIKGPARGSFTPIVSGGGS
jgi:adenylate cyclase